MLRYLIWGSWAVFFAYWYFSARRTKPTCERQSREAQMQWRGPLIVSYLLLAFAPWGSHDRLLLPRGVGWGEAGAGLALAGLAFCIWARRTLGANWSGTVTLKQDHELIQHGPYRWVRNPIYTGMLVMLLGTALWVGRWSAALAMLLAIVGFVIKLRQEEAFMRRQFPEAYAAYSGRVKRLIPFVY
ncbi:MAG TPA: isoprenylcysteine carboxylmethyltransferase family protein [Terriglobales bacterium]|nr:isoprenylcysteine carboxylmethyltransferase family protein [Terriglobales bacterium]